MCDAIILAESAEIFAVTTPLPPPSLRYTAWWVISCSPSMTLPHQAFESVTMTAGIMTSLPGGQEKDREKKGYSKCPLSAVPR